MKKQNQVLNLSHQEHAIAWHTAVSNLLADRWLGYQKL